MIASLAGSVCSTPDHLGDGGVLVGQFILPVGQVFLCLVVPEVEIVLSHEEQQFGTRGRDAFQLG